MKYTLQVDFKLTKAFIVNLFIMLAHHILLTPTSSWGPSVSFMIHITTHHWLVGRSGQEGSIVAGRCLLTQVSQDA